MKQTSKQANKQTNKQTLKSRTSSSENMEDPFAAAEPSPGPSLPRSMRMLYWRFSSTSCSVASRPVKPPADASPLRFRALSAAGDVGPCGPRTKNTNAHCGIFFFGGGGVDRGCTGTKHVPCARTRSVSCVLKRERGGKQQELQKLRQQNGLRSIRAEHC